MKKQVVWLSVILIVLFLAIVGGSFLVSPKKQEVNQKPTTPAVVDGPKQTYTLFLHDKRGYTMAILVEVADTKAERALGLMNRAKVENSMLFVFPYEQDMAFWMKNTQVPLDIFFFDAQKKFISSTTMDPCTADPCQLYPSARIAKYALETPRGFLAKYHLDDNWSIDMKL